MDEQQITAEKVPGVPFTKDDPRINREGRPKETEETKIIRKARKQLIEEYKDALAEALPVINPVLIKKALTGNVPAIKEIHDRVMDKAKQPTEISGKDGSPISLKWE